MTPPALETVVAYLCGEGPLHGHWYGDGGRPPGAAGPYWWRADLRAAVTGADWPDPVTLPREAVGMLIDAMYRTGHDGVREGDVWHCPDDCLRCRLEHLDAVVLEHLPVGPAVPCVIRRDDGPACGCVVEDGIVVAWCRPAAPQGPDPVNAAGDDPPPVAPGHHFHRMPSGGESLYRDDDCDICDPAAHPVGECFADRGDMGEEWTFCPFCGGRLTTTEPQP